MKKNKFLKIINYNKQLQKRLNLSIKDLKYYSQKFSSIIIELKPTQNIYGEFINIAYQEKDFYHIYFDNSKKRNKKKLF